MPRRLSSLDATAIEVAYSVAAPEPVGKPPQGGAAMRRNRGLSRPSMRERTGEAGGIPVPPTCCPPQQRVRQHPAGVAEAPVLCTPSKLWNPCTEPVSPGRITKCGSRVFGTG